jgi:leucyl-tRNA synthetase
MGFNTMVSALMIFVNDAAKADAIPLDVWKDFLRILAPVAPHITDELWSRLPGARHSIQLEAWPVADTGALTSDTFTLIVQVNGKVRDRVEVATDITEEEAKKTALSLERVQTFLGKTVPVRVIYVPGRLVNIVV